MRRWGSQNQLETGVRVRTYIYTCLNCGEEEAIQLMRARPKQAKYCSRCLKDPEILKLFEAAYVELHKKEA